MAGGVTNSGTLTFNNAGAVSITGSIGTTTGNVTFNTTTGSATTITGGVNNNGTLTVSNVSAAVINGSIGSNVGNVVFSPGGLLDDLRQQCRIPATSPSAALGTVVVGSGKRHKFHELERLNDCLQRALLFSNYASPTVSPSGPAQFHGTVDGRPN